MPPRIFTPHTFPHDIVFSHRNKEIIIEITQINPKGTLRSDLKHQSIGSYIWARLFDIYRDCIIEKLERYNKKVGFLVISDKWKQYKYIREHESHFEKVNCYILFTDFKDERWPEKIAKKIKSKIII